MARKYATPFLQKVREEHSGKEIEFWFQDETRYGQKGKIAGIWAPRGTRPTVLAHGGFKNAYIFGSVSPITGKYVGTIFPYCATEEMNIHLEMVSGAVQNNAHAICILDGAGWHKANTLCVPKNISLLYLPPYSPELNPIERLWLWLKNRYLCNTIFKDVKELLISGEIAWKALSTELVKSICHTQYVEAIIS